MVGAGRWSCRLELAVGAVGGSWMWSWRGSRVRYCRSLSENYKSMWELESIQGAVANSSKVCGGAGVYMQGAGVYR